MKIVTTFVPNLYAVQYDGQEYDELERLFDIWKDIEYLNDFFVTHQADLHYFNSSVEVAIRRTRHERKQLRDLLLNAHNQGKYDIFIPLFNSEYRAISLSKQKAKKHWLRLYAVKIDEEHFLITGGAIKLTANMQERPHSQLELEKLTQCRDFLITNDVFDINSLEDFLEASQD